MRRWQWLAGSVLTLTGLVGGLVYAASNESAPTPRVVQIENDTPEVREMMRRRSEAVDPVAWMIRMATGVPIEEKEIAPGVFVNADARKFDDFTVIWRLAPGVDTSAVKLYRSHAASRVTVSTAEIVGDNGRAAQDWSAVDDVGVAALPASRAQGALGAGWLEVRAPVIVPSTAYTVTNSNDSGAGSLRQALIDANAAVGGAHVITISATGTINLLSALPLIVNISVSINGPGAASLTLNRSSGGNYAFFETPLVLYTQAFGFSGMRLQNGAGGSGAIATTGGNTTINQCVIANNFGSFAGGGVGLLSTNATITNTTFSGNSTPLQGSAINAQGSTLTISNSTFSGNQITGTNGNAGAISHFANGQSMTLTNVTFSGNTSASVFGGGAALVSQNPGSYRNTIFSGQSPQISGSGASSLGNNICSDGSGGLSAAGDLPNTNPLLAALGSYGGPNQTHALLPGSPAINAGTSTGAPTTDQRGISRVGTTDIGAYESRGFSMALASGNNQSTTVISAFANPLAVTVASANSEPVNGGRVSFTPPGAGPSATLAGNPATIASGTATSGTLTANGTAGGPYTVAASARGVATGVNFSLTNIAASADVGITKTNGTTTSTPGGSTTYTIVASNAGPSNAPGATVNDSFPANCTSINWTCAGAGGGTCAASGSGNISQAVNLPVGGSVTFTAICAIAASATGPLNNTASISPGVSDPNSGNNSATDSDTLTPQANLGITKTDGVSSVNVGSNTTYTITASNAGPSAVNGATVADTFPAACTSVNWTCVGAGGGTCVASGSGNINQSVNLPSGGSATFSAICAISGSATGTLVNTATVTAPPSATDPVPGNNSATDTDTLNSPIELSIADAVVVEGNAGTTTLNFTVALDAPANAGGVGFDIATQDAVATSPSDYTARTLSGQSIAQGQSSAAFAVTVNGDTAVEPDESLRVLVSNVTGATLIDGEAIGTIRTDEFRALAVNDTGKITCTDNTVTPTGTVAPGTPDPETAGFNEQDCTRGASAADALGVLYKQGGSSQPGRDYSKIANDGSVLPNSATLGSAPGDWACTRDNTTGLIWEVKTDDGGLRDKDHRYTWYEPETNRNGGNAGSTGSDSCASTLPGGLCNMQAYRTAVNALAGNSRLCGATDWRLPDLAELHTLIHYGVPISDPSIDIAWFPNSISSTGGIHFNGFYWSRETNAKFPNAGWGVYFSPVAVGGYVEGFDKIALRHVRLVRGGQ